MTEEGILNQRRFNPSHAHRLDDPGRKEWLPPGEVVAALKLQPGWTVADIGAGTGYFTVPVAHAVGSAGRVFAVDVAAEMLEKVKSKVAASQLGNVEYIEAEASATSIPEECCDAALLANVWHEFDDHAAVLSEVKRILKPGGRIALLDWRADVEPTYGPPVEHRIPEDKAAHSLSAAGLRVHGPKHVGLYSWLLLGEKQRERIEIQ